MVNCKRRKVILSVESFLASYLHLTSINYVNKVASKLPKGALRLSTPVHSVANSTVEGKHKVTLRTVSGHIEHYDHVIMATHSGTTLRILQNGGQATAEEKAILGGFQWTLNPTVLHSDTSVSSMPSSLLHLI